VPRRAGNHDMKRCRKLRAATPDQPTVLPETSAEEEPLDPEVAPRPGQIATSRSLVATTCHDAKLVVAHAGCARRCRARIARVRDSPCTARPGETDEFGLPIRYNWRRSTGAGTRRLRPHPGSRADADGRSTSTPAASSGAG